MTITGKMKNTIENERPGQSAILNFSKCYAIKSFYNWWVCAQYCRSKATKKIFSVIFQKTRPIKIYSTKSFKEWKKNQKCQLP